MRINKLLPLLLSGVLMLGACNFIESSSSNQESTTTSESSDTSSTESTDTTTSSGGKKTAKEKLEDSLAMDYSNCYVTAATKYKEFEDDLASDAVTRVTNVIYYDGYAILYDETMALYEYPNPYLYYHDYNGQNLMFFEGNGSGEVDAWLAEYENGTKYALKYTEFYLPAFLEGINAEFCTYYAGSYYITDEAEVERLNKDVFCGIWENDFKAFVIMLNDDGQLYKIWGFEDLDNDTEYTVITVDQIGTTYFDETKLPEAPNENNVMEYWQHKGWSGPSIEVYPTAVNIECNDTSVAAQNPISLEIDEYFTVKSTLTWPTIDPNRHNNMNDFVTWHSTNEKVAKCSYINVDGNWIRTVVAIGSGNCEIYAVAEGENPVHSYDTYDHGVESNHIAVSVVALRPIDKTGCKYDIYFDSLSPDNRGTNADYRDMTYYDWSSGAGISGTCSTLNAKSYDINDLFYEGDDALKALVLDPNNMQCESTVIFTLDEAIDHISFYYAFYYDHMANLENLKSVTISTSNDNGETWTDVDVTNEVKQKISAVNLKLMDKDLASGNKVKITVESISVGNSLAFATSNIVLY